MTSGPGNSVTREPEPRERQETRANEVSGCHKMPRSYGQTSRLQVTGERGGAGFGSLEKHPDQRVAGCGLLPRPGLQGAEVT